MKIKYTEFTDNVININKTVAKFTENIIEAAEQSISYLKLSTKKPQVPWQNNEIKKYMSQKNKALKLNTKHL